MYLQFFQEKGHAVIKSASLIPENDPTVLFTTAGMHPLIPYLTGQTHPAGNRLTDVQKCVRTGDIDEVGDASHCTFFEMLGNWSLGDYFKEDAIKWSYEFLTDPRRLGIDKNKLVVSVFEGDNDAPRDEESAEIWKKCGLDASQIFYLPKKNNWWIAGETGPCGPDTEMFFDTGKEKCGEKCGPDCDCGKYLEIWNDVFMQYYKNADGTYSSLTKKNVDTGMGLERTVCVLNGYQSVYDTDVFSGCLELLEKLSNKKYGSADDVKKAMRIVADHTRTATFILGDEVGVTPSNVDQGYVLRRLIRRAIRFLRQLEAPRGAILEIASAYIDKYKDVYAELENNRERILSELQKEESKFSKALEQGEKEFERVASKLDGKQIDGQTAFRLYDTFGFPIELTKEFAAEKGLTVDEEGFKTQFVQHQKKSQAGSEQRFKGGLAETSEITTKLHTATHLLQAALRKVLGGEVAQKGSNITEERLRFDFSFYRPMTQEEIKQTEDLVNEAIQAALPVDCREMSVENAKNENAIGLFGDRYGETVKVYSFGDFSKEICGGPHVSNTSELGTFVIAKEQSSSSGVRRIRGELK
jgi:alanyl-tRNA synthetase